MWYAILLMPAVLFIGYHFFKGMRQGIKESNEEFARISPYNVNIEITLKEPQKPKFKVVDKLS